MESILTSIKKLLGIDEAYEAFDTDIIIHINSIFSVLNQLGVGPKTAFCITGKDETWDDFEHPQTNIDYIKDYIYLKVRLIFDPPTNSSAMEAFQAQAAELEWRLGVECDDTWLNDEGGDDDETSDD